MYVISAYERKVSQVCDWLQKTMNGIAFDSRNQINLISKQFRSYGLHYKRMLFDKDFDRIKSAQRNKMVEKVDFRFLVFRSFETKSKHIQSTYRDSVLWIYDRVIHHESFYLSDFTNVSDVWPSGATAVANIHWVGMCLQWIVIDSIRNNACVHINIDTLTSSKRKRRASHAADNLSRTSAANTHMPHTEYMFAHFISGLFW